MKHIIPFLVALTPLGVMAQTYPSTLTLTSAFGAPVEMILVEAGSFYMGSQNTDATGINYNPNLPSYNEDEGPVHRVTMSAFYISKYEVTQEVWCDVMGGNVDPDSANYAKGFVSYYLAQNFVAYAPYTYGNIPTGGTIALPTEEQWEYAARGGNSSDMYVYAGSNSADNVAQWGGVTKVPTVVGQKQPNSLGIYDMSGNAREWTQSDYIYYEGNTYTQRELKYVAKVQRGGDIGSRSTNLVSVSNRSYSQLNLCSPEFGLRFVINLPQAETSLSVPEGEAVRPMLVISGGGMLVLLPDGRMYDMMGRLVR